MYVVVSVIDFLELNLKGSFQPKSFCDCFAWYCIGLCAPILRFLSTKGLQSYKKSIKTEDFLMSQCL